MFDERGIYNYKLVNGEVIKRTDEDKMSEIMRMDAVAEISKLKQQLVNTDYIPLKIVEGAATFEQYSEKLAERVQWRKRINELEALL